MVTKALHNDGCTSAAPEEEGNLQRASDVSGHLRGVFVHRPSESEIGNLRIPVLVEKNVLRFDVSVEPIQRHMCQRNSFSEKLWTALEGAPPDQENHEHACVYQKQEEGVSDLCMIFGCSSSCR